MAKRHYIPITAENVPNVSESKRAFIRKVIRTALAAEGVDFPCEVDVLLTNDEAIHQSRKGLYLAGAVFSAPSLHHLMHRIPQILSDEGFVRVL